MDKTMEDSIKESVEMYHRKIKPSNKKWKVLSIESGLHVTDDFLYRHFGVGNDFYAINILSNTDIPKEKWDLIIVSQSLQYIFDFMDFIEGCFDILKPGGFFIVDCPFVSEYSGDSRYEDYWRISHKAMQKILNDIGFEYGNCGLVNGMLTTALVRKGKEEKTPNE